MTHIGDEYFDALINVWHDTRYLKHKLTVINSITMWTEENSSLRHTRMILHYMNYFIG